MKFHREIVDIWDAQKRIEPWIRPLDTEKVKLIDSIGRYLGENVSATHDFPHFRRSMMDGFAVRSTDTKGASDERPVALKVIESIPCGAVPKKTDSKYGCAHYDWSDDARRCRFCSHN